MTVTAGDVDPVIHHIAHAASDNHTVSFISNGKSHCPALLTPFTDHLSTSHGHTHDDVVELSSGRALRHASYEDPSESPRLCAVVKDIHDL